MLFGQKKGGEPLSRAKDWDYSLRKPEMVGKIYGLGKIISPIIHVRHTPARKREYVFIECIRCGTKKWILYDNLCRGIAKGCRKCLQPKRFPLWLYQRIQNKQQVCQNKENRAWKYYGGRGIEFRFSSVAEACLWIIKNLGIPPDKSLEIDRIDNDGHYEPGNIRWSTHLQNTAHTTRNPITPKLHRFKQLYPYITYTDGTLKRYFHTMTVKQIVLRWENRKRGGNSAKGVVKNQSGISLMPDPFIASQCKDF
jgi:hypothetical protein